MRAVVIHWMISILSKQMKTLHSLLHNSDANSRVNGIYMVF